jgi:hypothetical protein
MFIGGIAFCSRNGFHFRMLHSIWLIMPERKKGTRQKLTAPQRVKRIAITFRLPEDDMRRLGVAAMGAGLSKTVYVLLALRAQFDKDGID